MFIIEIEDDNAAFENDKPGMVATLLRSIAEQVEAGFDAGKIMDPNGNTVGSYKWQG